MYAITNDRLGYGPVVMLQASISYALTCVYMTNEWTRL